MALSPDFERYLAHFGHTVAVSSLYQEPKRPGLCALRHDIDYDLDVALEMAYWEHELGARATYFVLPTASYWDDPRLLEKCLQLQDYGHEVGLHVNCMAQWAGGATDDPEATLRQQLARLRDGGVQVQGISAHGDPQCYKFNVSNYWCFQELCPADPTTSENGRTAEGLCDPNNERRLNYPHDHEVKRPDGTRIPLWSISMASLGLNYHAWHTVFDRYFSDSGGSWKQTPDPIECARERQRWQVLIHPIYWRGPRRIYFFLSTARSGSRWLSQVLDEGTPLQARHEYIFNQEYHHGESGYKGTADIRRLEIETGEVRARLAEAWEELGELKNDYAEVNVYLETFLEELQQFFPSATFVHLCRSPKDVVRSLMDRDWYDTPEDPNHPRLRQRRADDLTRFERVCEYVAQANSRLLHSCDHRLWLEELSGDPKKLEKDLAELGIVYHQRLGRSAARQVINATQEPKFPKPENWEAELKRSFVAACGRCAMEMGYGGDWLHVVRIKYSLRRWFRNVHSKVRRYKSTRLIACGPSRKENVRARGMYCSLSEHEKPPHILIKPNNVDRNAYMILGGSDWYTASCNLDADGRSHLYIGNQQNKKNHEYPGWSADSDYYVRGIISAKVSGKGSVTIFSINYNGDGRQIYRRRLGALDPTHPRVEFAFNPHPVATRFDIALYMSVSQRPDSVVLNDWCLERKAH